MEKINYEMLLKKLEYEQKNYKFNEYLKEEEARKKEVWNNKNFQLIVVMGLITLFLFLLKLALNQHIYDEHLKMVYDVALNCS